MKKTIFLILCLMACLFVSAQTIEKTYYFGQPSVAMMQGYEQIQFTGCMQSAMAGQPSLPWQNVSLMLPQGTEAAAIEVVLSDFQTMEGSHNLYPYQTALTYSDPVRKQFEKDEALYASKSIYPAQAHGQLSTQYLNGVGFAFSAFTPVQYIPGTGEVRYATKATVRITTTAAKADQSRKLWLNGGNAERAMRLAQNPEMLQTYNSKGRTVGGYDLLVVTTQPYINAFDEYVAFYQARGLRTRVVDLSTILSTMEGSDSQEKLRNYIIQEYEDNGIMMVNLGGDVPDIPYRGLYCYVTSGGGDKEDYDIPADLYYAALDGNWNNDGDNLWGEIGEDDLLPEIGIGRMCFSNQGELDNMLHKAMTYQTEPVLGEFRDVIMAGEHLYDDPMSNGSQYLEMLIGAHDDNGYTTTGIPENYNFTRLYEEEGNWSGTLLRNAINQGTQYVHHDGHANTNYVAGWTNGDITNGNFSSVNGVDHNYTFFHTSGCICGDFSSDCILELMTKITNFAVATFGNSRYGWFNEGQTEGPAIHLARETEDAYYNDRIPYGGMALRESKIATAPWVNAPGQWEEGALRWNFYDLNMMGDVAVSPWHDEPFTPEVTYASEILVGTASMEVTVANANGDGLKNFRCALFHGDDMIGVGYTDEDGSVTIEFADPIDFVGEMSLIVTGCDAWPQALPVLSLPGNCAYVIYNDYEISGGAQPDYGQSIALDMQIKNVGTVTANNVTATLSTDCDYITLTDATETIASIEGGATINLAEAFAMDIADDVPNLMKADFNLSCTDGTDTWESKFAIRLHAPEFAVVGTDLEDGDGNGQIDPGETVTAHITVKNAGLAAAPDTRLNVICDLPEIVYEQGDFQVGTVNADEEFTIDFVFVLSEETPLGVAYEIGFNTTSGHYSTEGSFAFSVGIVTEDWETGDFSKFEWENDPSMPWAVVTENPYEGNYCVKSGAIGDNQSTSLAINLEVHSEGEISFYRKVSSESGFDKLYFYIDGNEKGNWSGEVSWGQLTYALPVGHHELKWTYKKDVYVANGSDCAWLDNIIFPPSDVITVTQETVMNGLALYPNPNKGQFSINLPEEDCVIVVFNSLGQQVYSRQAKGETTLNLEALNSGMYFVTVKSASGVSTLKFVKE
ncbi:MAG: T9SS type A sorting domain-containing protein [Bacteroidales bacterium]|nr:T9SS type A sorting domain-containing protein [Bacteroidales bacterium]